MTAVLEFIAKEAEVNDLQCEVRFHEGSMEFVNVTYVPLYRFEENYIVVYIDGGNSST